MSVHCLAMALIRKKVSEFGLGNFVTDGMQRAAGKGKPGKIQSHFQSNRHKAALLDYAKFCNESKHVDLLLDRSRRTRLIEEEKVLKNKEMLL